MSTQHRFDRYAGMIRAEAIAPIKVETERMRTQSVEDDDIISIEDDEDVQVEEELSTETKPVTDENAYEELDNRRTAVRNLISHLHALDEHYANEQLRAVHGVKVGVFNYYYYELLIAHIRFNSNIILRDAPSRVRFRKPDSIATRIRNVLFKHSRGATLEELRREVLKAHKENDEPMSYRDFHLSLKDLVYNKKEVYVKKEQGKAVYVLS